MSAATPRTRLVWRGERWAGRPRGRCPGWRCESYQRCLGPRPQPKVADIDGAYCWTSGAWRRCRGLQGRVVGEPAERSREAPPPVERGVAGMHLDARLPLHRSPPRVIGSPASIVAGLLAASGDAAEQGGASVDLDIAGSRRCCISEASGPSPTAAAPSPGTASGVPTTLVAAGHRMEDIVAAVPHAGEVSGSIGGRRDRRPATSAAS